MPKFFNIKHFLRAELYKNFVLLLNISLFLTQIQFLLTKVLKLFLNFVFHVDCKVFHGPKLRKKPRDESAVKTKQKLKNVVF